MVGAIYVEPAERARFLSPLDSVICSVVSGVSRVTFDVYHLYATTPSRVLFSGSVIATLTDFCILARLPGTSCDVFGIFRVIDDGERLVPALVLRPHEGI